MNYVINLKEVVLDLSLDQQLSLASYLVEGLYNYSDTFLDDGDDLQYRKFLLLKNKLEHSLSLLNSISPSDLDL